ncbi:predicted protein [Phaeodactylum tricornutum CCAP 1055/1]|jgi:hypothetical protein|uniref:Uncharacterized protein n=1 Tax=Phaeodactylum tricornutum (strain CCAP 1055/1) TaxID=556484 RepID=B7FVE9_PHATC|nr:predicted protein [Phaeodactylum tricornutum CCAP 1055/1]EEC49616.1 predicted protein [Phaeodactylum tricornutum CCAP 1055/1]|eukprot:XP_002178918.1 predicted protein [Phaeodactylum tricornutum CCAP 1055/1]
MMLAGLSPHTFRHIFSRTAQIAANYNSRTMNTITEGVQFDTIAREWRCKWSVSDDKKSLQEAQKALESVLADVKKVEGVKDVQRVVCGGCLDFKVMTSLPADKFGAWEEAKFAPEEDFLGKLKEIDGISTIETQTFTLMPM